tara:strand:+ start:31 stop:612 length:582 start_codon:yes stop_codon:yes gene_type:complete
MQNFRKPDLNAPRYRIPKKKIITKKYVKEFREKYPEYGEIGLSTLKNIVKAFNGKLWQNAIENRDGIELPENLGNVFIGACQKASKENIDYGKSIKYGIRVTHKNWDTDGYISKIFYSNYHSRYRLRDRSLWGFVASRYFKRAVTKSFKEDWKRYIVIDKNFTVSKLFASFIIKHNVEKKQKEQLNTYNEFEL